MDDAQREQPDDVLLRSWLWIEAKRHGRPEPEPAADVIAALRAQIGDGYVAVGTLVADDVAIMLLSAALADRTGWTQPE